MEWYIFISFIVISIIASLYDEKRNERERKENVLKQKIEIQKEKRAEKREFSYRNFLANWIVGKGKQYEKCKGYPPDWKIRRQYILMRDDFTCKSCGKIFNVDFVDVDGSWQTALLNCSFNVHDWNIGYVCEKAHVHHIIRVKNGGTHEAENLQTLCESCHTKQDGHKALHRRVKTDAYYRTYTDNNKLKTAKITHECDICEREIGIGERYFGGIYMEKGSRSRTNYFGVTKISKICLDCFKRYDYRSRRFRTIGNQDI